MENVPAKYSQDKSEYCHEHRLAWAYANSRESQPFRVKLFGFWHSSVKRAMPGLANHKLAVLWGVKLASLFLIIFFPILLTKLAGLSIIDHGPLLCTLGYVVALMVHRIVQSKLSSPENTQSRYDTRAQLYRQFAFASHQIDKALVLADESPDVESARKEAKSHLANCIGLAARLHVNNDVEQLTVNVFVFTAENCQTMEACCRDDPTALKLRDRTFDCQKSPLYYSAVTGKCLNLYDTHWSWHPYEINRSAIEKSKSKYVIPLFDEPDKYFCWGVVSIESDRPFYFFSRGGRGLDLIIEPYLTLLKLLIGTNGHSLQIDKSQVLTDEGS